MPLTDRPRRGGALNRLAVTLVIFVLIFMTGSASLAHSASAPAPKGQSGLTQACEPCGSGGCWIPYPPPGHCSQGGGGGGCGPSIASVNVFVAGNGASATISWTDNPSNMTDAFSYQLAGSTNWQNAAPSGHSVTISGLTVPHVYYFTIKATEWCHSTTTANGQLWTSSSGGGACPEVSPTVTLSSSSSTPWSASLTWTESPSGSSNPGAGDTLNWGTNTLYQYQPMTPTSHSIVLQDLAPSTTYYYQILDSDGNWIYSCRSSGVLTGSVTTASAQSITTIVGTVYDTNGATAPANVIVYDECDVYSGGAWTVMAGSTSYSTLTNSNGGYSVAAPKAPTGQTCGGWQVGANRIGSFGWSGRWLEQSWVYANTGTVNFFLQTNVQLPVVPLFMEFTHTQYAGFSISSSTTITDTISLSIGGTGASAQVSLTTTTTVSANTGQNLEAADSQMFSGIATFDAVHSRGFAVTELIPVGTPFYSQVSTLFSDYLNMPGSCVSGSSPCVPLTIGPGNTYSTAWGLTGSVNVFAGFDGSICVGVVFVSACANVAFSLSAGVSTTQTLTFSIINTDSLTHTFWVYEEGDPSTGSAMVLHIWQYS